MRAAVIGCGGIGVRRGNAVKSLEGVTLAIGVDVVENLAQSACSRVSGNRLWCGSCHDPGQRDLSNDQRQHSANRNRGEHWRGPRLELPRLEPIGDASLASEPLFACTVAHSKRLLACTCQKFW